MVGSAVRSTLSTQPVHSWSWIQTTEGRVIVSRARAIRGMARLIEPEHRG